jgi:hypothetical protein
MLTLKIGKITQVGLTGSLTRLDRLGQSPQKSIWTSPLDRTHRVDQDSYIERPNRSPDEGGSSTIESIKLIFCRIYLFVPLCPTFPTPCSVPLLPPRHERTS